MKLSAEFQAAYKETFARVVPTKNIIIADNALTVYTKGSKTSLSPLIKLKLESYNIRIFPHLRDKYPKEINSIEKYLSKGT